jgi:hypothetical protein
MNTRTTKKTITFLHPCLLDEFDEILPAGRYNVETDEELLEGPSFPVYRKTLSFLHLPTAPGQGGFTRTLTITPKALDEAIERDRAWTAPQTEQASI